jgi:hypothetical protein
MAQNNSQNDYSISVNGHRINTTSNFKQQVEQLKSAVKQSEKFNTLCCNFLKSTIEEQKELSKQGINVD